MTDLVTIPVTIFARAEPLATLSTAARGHARCGTIASAGCRHRAGAAARLDALARRWLRRSRSPYVPEIEAIAAALGLSRHLVSHGSYQWAAPPPRATKAAHRGSRARSTGRFPVSAGPRDCAHAGRRRGIFMPHLARLCRALTALAPGRFAAAINQAPLWRRTTKPWLRPIRYRGQRAGHLAHPLLPARPSAARGVRDLPRFRRSQAPARRRCRSATGDLHPRRLRKRRALVIERTEEGFASRLETPRSQRLAACHALVEARGQFRWC